MQRPKNSFTFAQKYKDDVDGFLSYIFDSGFSRMNGYKQSWDFIKTGLHSLERHTNLGLCFAEFREYHFILHDLGHP